MLHGGFGTCFTTIERQAERERAATTTWAHRERERALADEVAEAACGELAEARRARASWPSGTQMLPAVTCDRRRARMSPASVRCCRISAIRRAHRLQVVCAEKAFTPALAVSALCLRGFLLDQPMCFSGRAVDAGECRSLRCSVRLARSPAQMPSPRLMDRSFLVVDSSHIRTLRRHVPACRDGAPGLRSRATLPRPPSE